MNVKGTFYVLTKATMIAGFGEERWNSFMSQAGREGQIFQHDDYVHYPYSDRKINHPF